MRDKPPSSPQASHDGNEENGIGVGVNGVGDKGVDGDGVVMGKGDGEELMCVRKSLLDAMVLRQAKRIMELERKLEKRKQVIDRLSAIQVHVQQHGGGMSVGNVGDGVTQFYLGGANSVGSGNGAGLNGDAPSIGPGLLAKEAATKCMMGMGGNVFSRMMGGLPGMGMGVGMGGGMGAMGMGMGLARAVGCIGSGGKGGGIVGRDKKQSRYWTADEHHRFLAAVKTCGPKNYQQIAEIVGSRNAKQVRTHAQKFHKKLEREAAKRRAAAAAMTAAANGAPGVADKTALGLSDNAHTYSTDASNSVSPIAAAAAAACSQIPHVASANIAAAEAAATAAAAAAVEAATRRSEACKIPEEAAKKKRPREPEDDSTSATRKSKRLRSLGESSTKLNSQNSSSGTFTVVKVEPHLKVEPMLDESSTVPKTDSDGSNEKRHEEIDTSATKDEGSNSKPSGTDSSATNSKSTVKRNKQRRLSDAKHVNNKPFTRSRVKRESMMANNSGSAVEGSSA